MESDTGQEQIKEKPHSIARVACQKKSKTLDVAVQPLLKKDGQDEDEHKEKDGHPNGALRGRWR